MNKSIMKFLENLREINTMIEDVTKKWIKGTLTEEYLTKNNFPNTKASNQILDDEDIDKINPIYYMAVEIMRVLENDLIHHKNLDVYSNFECLSQLLMDKRCTLGLKDKINVIMYFVKRNCELRDVKNHIMIDTSELAKAKLNTLTPVEITDLISSGRLSRLLDPQTELTPKEIMQKNEIIAYFLECEEKFKPKATIFKAIKTHYLDKEDSYTDKDIKFVQLALRDLKVEEALIQIITNYLEKKLNERIQAEEEKEKKSENKPIYRIPSENSKKYITEAEYKKGLKEIRKYYDIRNRVFIEQISYEKMLDLIYIMTQISYPKQDIETFIFDFYRDNYTPDISIGGYIFNRDKLLYYGVDVEYLDSIIDAMIEVGIDEKEYLDWKREFINSFSSYMSMLPANNYEYEINLAKNR